MAKRLISIVPAHHGIAVSPSDAVRDSDPAAHTVPPERADQSLARPTLLTILDRSLRAALTLVHGPAGFGKSQLLRQWQRHLLRQGFDVLWMTEYDFQNEERLGVVLDRLHREAFASGAATHVASRLTKIVILDAPYLDQRAPLACALRRFVLEPLQGIHVAVACRRRPAFMSKAIAEGAAAALGPAELRFQPAEIGELLIVTDTETDIVARVAAATEGWPLAVAYIRRGLDPPITAENVGRQLDTLARDLTDYFEAEVLPSLPLEVVQLLTATAPLARMTGELAEHASGIEGAAGILHHAAREALFVRSDGAGWYYVQPLLREYLRSTFDGTDERPNRSILVAAGRWLAARGHYEEAAQYARRGADLHFANELISQAGGARIAVRSGLPMLTTMLGSAGDHASIGFPRVELARAMLMFKRGCLPEARQLLEAARERRARLTETERSAMGPEYDVDFWVAEQFGLFYDDASALESQIPLLERRCTEPCTPDPWLKAVVSLMLFKAHFRMGALSEATNANRAANFWCEEANAPYSAFFTILHAGTIALERGEISNACDLFKSAEHLATSRFASDRSLLSLSHFLHSAALLETENRAASSVRLDASIPQIARTECWLEVYTAAFLTAAALRETTGGLAGAIEVLDEAMLLAKDKGLPRLQIVMFLAQADLQSRLGDIAQAQRLLTQLNFSAGDGLVEAPAGFTWHEIGLGTLALARILIKQFRPQAALQILQPFVGRCENNEWVRFCVRALVLTALAHQEAGSAAKAFTLIDQVFQLTLGQRWVFPFLNEGREMERLLRCYVRHHGVGTLPHRTLQFIAELLTEFNRRSGKFRESGAPFLSGRESAILDQLSQGNSNKQIARNLHVAENTVKFHIRNLFEKLGAHDRKLAVEIARRLSLLKDDP